MTADLEATLLGILRTQLDDDAVGPDDDFYASGGDSIIALRVVAAATRQGVPVELIDLLYYPTVNELAAELAHRLPGPATVSAAEPFALLDTFDRALVPVGVADAWPASALQVGLIYLCEQSGDPALYHDLIGVEVVGRFDEDRFGAALTELCRRHPALRSCFDLGTFAEPVQLVWPSTPVPLTVVAGTETDPATWRAAELSRAIDWHAAPLFRCHVAVLDGSFHVMLAIHHAVIDGWSFATAVTELLTIYDGLVEQRPPVLPAEPPGGHQMFVQAERSAAASADAARFWRAEADAPVMLLDRKRFGGAANPAEMLSFPIDPVVFGRLRTAANRIGVPLKSLALGCHAWALGRLTEREQGVVTGLTVNGRPEIDDADRMIGLYLNNVPLRLDSVAGDCLAVAREAMRAEQRIMPFRRYPLNHIEAMLGRPAFDVLFNFTHFHPYRDLDRLDAMKVASWWSYDKASLPLTVDFMIESRRFGTAVAASYDPDLLPSDRVRRFLRLYQDALHVAAEFGTDE
ncbi:condensation domain-containing protein [Actinophytocola sp.]|uniref:condensation domain-containing protein n=1 Tax=Actinophytocola sp. TaxID=1872138 RepID=UPI003D6A11F5